MSVSECFYKAAVVEWQSISYNKPFSDCHHLQKNVLCYHLSLPCLHSSHPPDLLVHLYVHLYVTSLKNVKITVQLCVMGDTSIVNAKICRVSGKCRCRTKKKNNSSLFAPPTEVYLHPWILTTEFRAITTKA